MLSFLLSLLVVLNICLSPKLRDQVFQRLSMLLALTDLIQSGCWILGPKYDSPYAICATQEYLLQFGACSKAGTTMVICCIALYISSYSEPPSKVILQRVVRTVLFLPPIAQSVSIYFKTARLFCTYDLDLSFSEASPAAQRAMVTYAFTMFGLNGLFIIVSSICCVMVIIKIRRMQASATRAPRTLNVEQQQLSAAVTRMSMYPLIVVSSWLPAVALFVLVTTSGRFNYTLALIAAVCISSSGSGVALSYFYYQRTFPEPCMHFLQVRRRTGGLLDANFTGIESIGTSLSWTLSWSENQSSICSSPDAIHSCESAKRSSASSNTGSWERAYTLARSLLPNVSLSHSHTASSPSGD